MNLNKGGLGHAATRKSRKVVLESAIKYLKKPVKL